MSFSNGMDIVASSAKMEFGFLPLAPENNGAGGSGRLGLPPYLDEGVPGRGCPSRSAGSKLNTEGGRRVNSFEPLLEGLHDLVGDILPLEAYGFALSGGRILGAVSAIDGARECEEMTVGW